MRACRTRGPQDGGRSCRYILFRMRTARLIIAIAVSAGAALGCRRPATDVAAGMPARGDVVRDAAAARANTDRAYRLIESGRYADAEPLLRRAIEQDSTYGPAHNDLGVVDYHFERMYEAAWQFETAIKLMPNEAQPQNNLGLVLESAAKPQEAEAAYARAHALDARNPEYAGNLARVRIRLDKRDEQTRGLLELVVMADRRPEWVEWARFNLTRLRPAFDDSMPMATTRPQSRPATGND